MAGGRDNASADVEGVVGGGAVAGEVEADEVESVVGAGPEGVVDAGFEWRGGWSGWVPDVGPGCGCGGADGDGLGAELAGDVVGGGFGDVVAGAGDVGVDLVGFSACVVAGGAAEGGVGDVGAASVLVVGVGAGVVAAVVSGDELGLVFVFSSFHLTYKI